jgi:hypothetical protein
VDVDLLELDDVILVDNLHPESDIHHHIDVGDFLGNKLHRPIINLDFARVGGNRPKSD